MDRHLHRHRKRLRERQRLRPGPRPRRQAPIRTRQADGSHTRGCVPPPARGPLVGAPGRAGEGLGAGGGPATSPRPCGAAPPPRRGGGGSAGRAVSPGAAVETSSRKVALQRECVQGRAPPPPGSRTSGERGLGNRAETPHSPPGLEVAALGAERGPSGTADTWARTWSFRLALGCSAPARSLCILVRGVGRATAPGLSRVRVTAGKFGPTSVPGATGPRASLRLGLGRAGKRTTGPALAAPSTVDAGAAKRARRVRNGVKKLMEQGLPKMGFRAGQGREESSWPSPGPGEPGLRPA